MKFTKFHSLGNDYIVVDPKYLEQEITARDIKVLCDRNYGVGSDGVLYGPLESSRSDFGLRIFNPDASEAEKSGNGLRIFSRYLWDCGLVREDTFSIETKGGDVSATVQNNGKLVSVNMGKVRFTHGLGNDIKVQAETISVIDQSFGFYRANVGNPHCVILVKELSPSLAEEYGRLIEESAEFKNRTNVQFMKVLNRDSIQIEIWERGAGYTLASGSSSTAAAAVAHALGLCDSEISVHMPGGVIEITLNNEFYATMKGPVVKIGDGNLENEAIEAF